MQGSHHGAAMHTQDYRGRLRALIEQYFPGADVYDPLSDHIDSLNYSEQSGRQVFMHHNRMCGEVDVVLAFVPEASMGTAIEIWEAHRQGRTVICISPLRHNWAVKFLSQALYADMAAFEQALASGEVAAVIQRQQAARSDMAEGCGG